MGKFSARLRVAALFGSTALASVATSAHAEQVAQNTIEEVVVTAQRSSQSVQSVPIAVTAMNSEMIENKGIATVTDLQYSVPNIQMREEAGVGGLTVAIRGISVTADNFSFDSAVGVYQNEVFIARANDFTSTFYDMNSIQVLRGPQGTLFGRNTAVGAVLLETVRPGSELGGYFKATMGWGGGSVGNGADRFLGRYEGAINVPASDRLAFRLAGYYENDGGYGRSRVTGYNYYGKNDFGIRGSARLDLTDNFRADLILEHSETDRGAPLYLPVRRIGVISPLQGGTAAQAAIDAIIAAGDRYHTDSELTNKSHNRARTNSATLLMSLNLSSSWQLRSITGWRDTTHSTQAETDATQFFVGSTPSRLEQDQISQELVLTGDFLERFRFVGGLYYFKETGLDQNLIATNVTTLPTGAFFNPLLLKGQDFNNKAKAVFGNLSFKVTPTLTLTGGLRYTEEDKHVFVNSYLTGTGTVLARGPQDFKDDATLYDVRIEWQATPDLLLYAKQGTGYRAGGIGFRAADAQFLPETAKTTEAGVKYDFHLGGAPARLNAAVFHSKYKDFQISTVLANPTRQTVVNAGAAKINGAEFEFTYRPTEALTLTSYLGLLDSSRENFVLNAISLGGLAVPGGRIDLSDTKLRGAPDVTAGGTLAYTVPSNIGEWLFQLDAAYSSSYEVDSVFQEGGPSITNTSLFHQSPTFVLNGRVRLGQAFGSKLDVSLWGRNLTDEVRKSYSLASSPIWTVVYGEPRSVGVELSARF